MLVALSTRNPSVLGNVFPNGSADTEVVLLQDTATGTVTHSTAESTFGRSSYLVTPKEGTKPLVRPTGGADFSVRPRRDHCVGIDVINLASVDMSWRLDLVVNGTTVTGVPVIVPKEGTLRIEETAYVGYPNAKVTRTGGVTTYRPRLSFVLAALDNHTTAQTFHLDRIYAGPGKSVPFVAKEDYAVESLLYGSPIRVWCRNKSAETLENIRAQMQGPMLDGPRPWIEVSSDPDTTAWSSAKIKPVVVRAPALSSGSSFPFWIRPVIDENVHTDEHRMQLILTSDV
jgi:hypothetical protein